MMQNRTCDGSRLRANQRGGVSCQPGRCVLPPPPPPLRPAPHLAAVHALQALQLAAAELTKLRFVDLRGEAGRGGPGGGGGDCLRVRCAEGCRAAGGWLPPTHFSCRQLNMLCVQATVRCPHDTKDLRWRRGLAGPHEAPSPATCCKWGIPHAPPRRPTCAMEADPRGSSKSIHSNTSDTSWMPSSLRRQSRAASAGMGGTCRGGCSGRVRPHTRTGAPPVLAALGRQAAAAARTWSFSTHRRLHICSGTKSGRAPRNWPTCRAPPGLRDQRARMTQAIGAWGAIVDDAALPAPMRHRPMHKVPRSTLR